MWKIIELSFIRKYLEELRWWFLWKWFMEGSYWRKEEEVGSGIELGKKISNRVVLVGVFVIYCCIFFFKLVV